MCGKGEYKDVGNILHVIKWSFFVIIDVAVQPPSDPPYFTTETEAVHGHSWKVKIIGVLEYGITNEQGLLTLPEDHESPTNHTVETGIVFLHQEEGLKSIASKFCIWSGGQLHRRESKIVRFSHVLKLWWLGAVSRVDHTFLASDTNTWRYIPIFQLHVQVSSSSGHYCTPRLSSRTLKYVKQRHYIV